MLSEFDVQLTEDELRNISYVDLAYAILNASGNTFHYKDLLLELGRRKGLAQEELTDVMATIYSEINIDGRFVSIGQNVWGLKLWYPTEKAAKNGPTPKRFKRNDEDYDDYDLEDDFYMDDEEEDYDDDADEIDADEIDADEDIDDDVVDTGEVEEDFDLDEEIEDIEEIDEADDNYDDDSDDSDDEDI